MQYKLGNIAIFIRNGVNIKNDKSKGGIPITRIETISDGIVNENKMGYADIIDDRYKDYYLKQNDILMSHINSAKHLGKVAIFNGHKKIIHGMNLLDIRLNNDICNSKYVYYFFKTKRFKKQLNKISKQSVNQSSFTVNDLKEIKISLPLLEKQKMIANKLDKVQAMIDLRKKQTEELDKLIKSQFVEMFQSGNYPKEELGKLCDVRDGTHDSPKYMEKSDYKFITSKNIINNGIDFSDVKYISKKDYDKFNTRSKVNYGDILMPMIGTIGKPMIVNIPDSEIDFAIKNVALIKFLDNSQVTNIYIKYLLDSDYFENAILQNKRGGTQKFIALSDIRKIQIEIPPIELQNQFAEIVKQIDKQKFLIEKSLKETKDLQESLMNKYFL